MSTAPSWESLQGTALVVGQGGIGTALVEALRQRQPQLELLWLGRRSTPRLDLTCDTDLDQLGEVLRGKPPLRLVLNTAGWLHDGQRGPEKRLSRVERAGLEQAFSINAYGAILLARAVESALGHGQSAWFASLSARVGSIGDNRLGGWYGYRAAKAAQNQLLRTLAVEWQRRLPSVCVTLLHPGTTATAALSFGCGGCQSRACTNRGTRPASQPRATRRPAGFPPCRGNGRRVDPRRYSPMTITFSCESPCCSQSAR